MALQHAQPLDVIDLHAAYDPRGTALTSSLLKTAQLQLMRVVLAAGKALPEHQVPGEITVQCLAGEVDVVTPQRTCRLAAGTLVLLPAGAPHRVLAHADAVLLVTVRHP